MADLGGLGVREGVPVAYQWTAPAILPLMIPWLAVLGLLGIRSNRQGGAWLIWVPIGLLCLLIGALRSVASAFPSELLDIAFPCVFGLAAVWLLAQQAAGRHRILTFLLTLATLGGFSAVAFAARLDWSNLEPDNIAMVIGLGLVSVVVSLAISLGSLTCRHRFRPVGFLALTVIAVAVLWMLALSPFFLAATISYGGRVGWGEFLVPMLVVIAATLVLIAPFLILSFVHPLFRERLRNWLHVDRSLPTEAPTIPTDPATEEATESPAP